MAVLRLTPPLLNQPNSSLLRIDNVHKRGLQTGTSDQEPIDILLLGQIGAVLLADTSTVDDARLLCDRGCHGFAEPFADGSVDFLGLLGGCDFAGTDGPVE